jgi:chloride channel 3/4/5
MHGAMGSIERELLSSRSRWHRCWHFVQRGSGWYMLALIGLSVGIFACFIELVWLWLDSIRIGYCTDNIFLSQATCCGVNVITGGTSQSGSDVSPYDISSDGDTGFSYDYGSYDCKYFQTWAQVYNSWKGYAPGSDGLSEGYWVAWAVYVITGCLMAALGTWLVLTFAYHARSSGIAEVKVILSGVNMQKFFGLWTLLIKTLGITLAVGSGLIVGKEGPFVHVACCIANIISRWFPSYHFNEVKKREILSAASSSGIGMSHRCSSFSWSSAIGIFVFSLFFCSGGVWRTNWWNPF